MYSFTVQAEPASDASGSALQSEPDSSSAVDWFVGVGYGRSTYVLNNVYVANASYKTRARVNQGALSAGVHVGRSRIYATAYKSNDAADMSLDHYSLSFDTKLMNFPFSPYAGVSVGYVGWEERGIQAKNPAFVVTSNNVTAKDNIKVSGVSYGAVLGLMYAADDIDVRLGYEFSKVNASDLVYFDGVAERFEIKLVRSYFANLSYRF